MAHTAPDRMDAIEIEAFLDSQQTGVLALAAESDAYAIPVSFVYDSDDGAVYLRLGYTPDSQKRSYVNGTESASLVVYDETDDGWKSVVVEGTLEEASETTLDSSVREAVDELRIPFFSVFDRPSSEMEFRISRIEVSSINGIVA